MYVDRAGNSCTAVTQGALAEEEAVQQQKGVVALQKKKSVQKSANKRRIHSKFTVRSTSHVL